MAEKAPVVPDSYMIYVYVNARARRDFPQWLGKTSIGQAFQIEAYDEHGRKYNNSSCYIAGSLKNVYDDLKRISLGKEPETLALLYINHTVTLFAEIARIIVSKGKDRIKFLGPMYNKRGGSNVYKNGLVTKKVISWSQ